MLDLATPEAHRPWCYDRMTVRSEDHASNGSTRCSSADIQLIKDVDVSIQETTRGTVEVHLWIHGACTPLPLLDALALGGVIETAVRLLAVDLEPELIPEPVTDPSDWLQALQGMTPADLVRLVASFREEATA
jgi:hypothetical protein